MNKIFQKLLISVALLSFCIQNLRSILYNFLMKKVGYVAGYVLHMRCKELENSQFTFANLNML